MQTKPSLYEKLTAAGCEIDSYQSDLYVLATPQARTIVSAYEDEGGLTNKSFFRSQLDGRQWIELPFHYKPYWVGKMESDSSPAPGM